jgi:hypothetical protein
MQNVSMSNASLWANQIAALGAQRALVPNALTAPGGNSPGAASVSATSRSQITQDLQSFTQSLQQALVSNQPAATQTGGAASAASATGAGSAPASVVPHGHGHHHGGARSKLESLINTLDGDPSTTAPTGAATGSASGNVANLNASFNKLMTDLGASASTAGSSGVAAAGSAAGAAASPQSSAALQGLLQGMLQHLQQQGARAASLGQGLHVVA